MPKHEDITSALELMRSRFEAYQKSDVDYIIQTTDPQNRDPRERKLIQEWMNQVCFLDLEIVSHEESGNKGRVEFKATFIERAKVPEGTAPSDFAKTQPELVQIHSEKSTFRKQAGLWYFKP